MRKGLRYAYHKLMLTLLPCLSLRAGATPTYNIEEHCNGAISRYEPVGILRLNTSALTSHQSNRRYCKVNVHPDPVPGSGGHGRVLFYFTQFDLPGSCSDMALKLLDGSSTFAPAPYVKGAPMPLCGHNATLTSPGLVFNTTEPLFSVVLQWTQPAATLRSGGFILKFAAFYNGPCKDSDEVATCKRPNNRCTSKAYHCHADIDTCGHHEESVCSVIAKKSEITEWLLVTARDIGIAVAICLIVLCFLRQIYKLLKSKYGSLSNFVRKLCGNRRNSSPHEPQDHVQPLRSRRDSLALSMEMTQRQEVAELDEVAELGIVSLAHSDSYASFESGLSGYEDDLVARDVGVIPSSGIARESSTRSISVSSLGGAITNLGARNPDPQAQSGLVDPPPSYDSLGPPTMTLPPSYEDVMSNEDRYTRTNVPFKSSIIRGQFTESV